MALTQPNPRQWSVLEVSEWLRSIELEGLVETFRAEEVDGATLFDLSEDDLKDDFKLTVGQRKKLLREKARLFDIDAASRAEKPNTSTSDPSSSSTNEIEISQHTARIELPKGYIPKGRKLTAEQEMKVRFKRYDILTHQWVPREEPLTDEEVECWNYQASWLVCPITGKCWPFDSDAILGLGLYHAPRFLSEKELKRAADDELQATLRKQAKKQKERELQEKLQADQPQQQAATANAGANTGRIALTSSGQRIKNDAGKETGVNWAKTFQVYPSVVPPPLENIENLGPLPDNVRLGHIEVIVGPAFDIRAYNDGVSGNKDKGILDKKRRGVLSMDQQYNAINFQYFVERATNSYERKFCTSRLSFYIDDTHGKKVFPGNIESQLALLLYRDANRFKTNAGSTDQHLLASAIRQAIPRILLAVIKEIITGHSSLLNERIEHCLRVYLLVHQVSIKLVLYYPEAYQALYRSIVRWIQNPFAPGNEAQWPELEEVLIGASLCGLPWQLLREAFMRRFIGNLVTQTSKMRSSKAAKQRINHIFHQNKALFHRVLYEFSFFIAGRPPRDADRVYSRCAGTLPARERHELINAVRAVVEVDTFQKFWVSLGMDSVTAEESDVTDHIDAYLTYVGNNITAWRQGWVPPTNDSDIAVPKFGEEMSVVRLGILNFNSEKERQLAEFEARERLNHQGYPILNDRGKLDPLTCLYPLCGRKFKCRDHLFRHLKRVIGDKRMIFGYHQKHFKLHVSHSDTSLQCGACEFTAQTVQEMHEHYARMGVPAFASLAKQLRAIDRERYANKGPASNTKGKEKALAEPRGPVDQYEDIHSCVVCMDADRQVVMVPCGHLVCCKDCGTVVKKCPICRADIQDCIVVFMA